MTKREAINTSTSTLRRRNGTPRWGHGMIKQPVSVYFTFSCTCRILTFIHLHQNSRCSLFFAILQQCVSFFQNRPQWNMSRIQTNTITSHKRRLKKALLVSSTARATSAAGERSDSVSHSHWIWAGNASKWQWKLNYEELLKKKRSYFH